MKNKRLALLLAAVLTVTSADSTVMIASGADFSSEAVDVEEENPQTANEETPVDDTDEDSVEVGQETDLSSEETDGEVAVEGDENEETVDLGDGSEELFSDEAGAELTAESIVPDDLQELSLDTAYTVNTDSNGVWFSFTPQEDGTYRFSSDCEEGIDPQVYLYDSKVESEYDYSGYDDDGGDHWNFLLNKKLKAGTVYYCCVKTRGSDEAVTVTLTKIKSIKSISATGIKTSLVAGFETADELLSECEISITYEDDSVYNDVYTDSIKDSYGYRIIPKLVQDESKVTFPSEEVMNVGNYGVCFAYEEDDNCIYSNIANVNVIPVTEADIYKGEISEGENTKEIQTEDIFSFTPSKSGRYSFTSLDSDPLDIVVKTESDGYYSQIYSQNGYCNMEAGTTYYIQNKGDFVESVSVSEVPEIASVTVDAKDISTSFIADLENCYAEGLKLTVAYKDGTEPVTFTFAKEDALTDVYGNRFSYYFQSSDLEGYYYNCNPGETLRLGTYTLKVSCNDSNVETETDITVTADDGKDRMPSLKLGDNLVEGTEKEYTDYNWYTFTPSEDGKYGIGPATTISVRKRIEDGMEYVNASYGPGKQFYFLEKDTTYYFGFSGGYSQWNAEKEDYDIVYQWDATIEKCPEVVSVTPSITDFTFTYGLENASRYGTLSGETLTVEYEDGSPEKTVSLEPELDGTITNKYGTEVWTEITDTNGEAAQWDDNNELLPGTYTLIFNCNKVKSTPVTITVKAFNYDDFPKLVIGKNKVKLNQRNDDWEYEDTRVWYAFETVDRDLYEFITDSEDYSIDASFRKVNEDGSVEMYYSETRGKAWELDRNSKYMVCFGVNKDAGVQETELTVNTVAAVTSVKVKSTVPENMTFIKGMETVRLQSAIIEVTYEDGSVKEYDTSEFWEDEYDRSVTDELVRKDSDGNYEEIYNYSNLEAGEYAYLIGFDGKCDVVPVKVVDPSEKVTDKIKDDQTTEMSNKDKMILEYTAKETGRYEVKFNVPISEIKIRSAEGKKPANSSVEKYKTYVNFEKDVTYYIYIKADEYCPELTVDVTPVTRPSEMTATALKKTYIAGIDDFKGENIQTEVTLGDKTRTVRGTDKIGGYYLQYKAQKKDTEDIVYDGDRLTTGTWEVSPYLSASISTGSAVAVEMAEIPVTAADITAEKMDLSKLPKFTQDQYESLKGKTNRERQWYAFTAKEAGIYYAEEDGDITGLVTFYKDGEEVYNEAGLRISLEAGETCLVKVETDCDTSVRIVKQEKAETEKPGEISELQLQDGTEKAVSISAGNTIKCTFTPDKDGYYTIQSENLEGDQEGVDTCVDLSCDGNKLGSNDDGDEDNNFKLTSLLEKGKTYTYTVRLYDEKSDGSFKILFNKTEVQPITDVKLVLREDASADDVTIFDNLSNTYEALVTYANGEEERIGLDELFTVRYENALDVTLRLDKETLMEKKTEYKVIFNTYSKVNHDGENETEFTTTVKVKGAGYLKAFELGKENDISEYTNDYRSFTPAESGEYILTVKGDDPEAVDRIKVYSDIATYWSGSAYLTADIALNYEGETTYSVQLEKGHTYFMNVSSYEAGNTISIKKAAKTLKGLKLLSAPDQKSCLPDGLNVLSLKGMKAQAYYTDGTSETITYGTPDSTGRYLHHSGLEWINNDLARAYVSLGKYQISFDLTAESWDNVQEIKAGQIYTPEAEKGDTLIYKFVPEKTTGYRVNVTGGYLLYVKADGVSDGLYNHDGEIQMEEGKAYYLHIHANSSDLNFHVVPEDEPLPCEWEETDRKEATCTEDGYVVTICKLHGEKNTTRILAKGHTPGEWTVTKEATALAEGSQEQRCTVCGDVIQIKKIAKLKAKIKLNVPKTLPLKVKQTFQIKASGLAKGDKVASFKSSNTKIVTVTSSGKIAGKKAGTATVTVKLKSGLTSQVKVKVQKSDVAATSVTVLNKSTNRKISGTVTLKVKKKLTLATTVAPVTCKQKVTFTSSNKKIATVTSSGVITAKKKGTVTITVKVGRKSAKVKIKVK